MSRVEGKLGKGLQWPLLNASTISGGQHILDVDVFPIGSRVRVANYGPFRGLKGTILTIHMIAVALEEPFCFYLVALEGVQTREPMWFEYFEVETVDPPHDQAAGC